MKHFIFAILLAATIAALLFIGLGNVDLLPLLASVQGEFIDWLFNLHLNLIIILFSLIIGFMLYSIIFFRKKEGDDSDGAYITGNTGLEIVWTVLPLGIVLFLSYQGAQILANVERIDPQALKVNVIGSQWSWRYEYPDYGVFSTELVLPVDQQTVLRLSSTDVIHSFWVPEFRIKQDVLPGDETMIREMRITPSLIGEYTARCAELCGTLHAYMTTPVIIVSSSDFQDWLETQKEVLSGDPVERGELWVKQFGCLSCHSVDGTTRAGPTWFNTFGSSRLLEDGSSRTIEEQYLFESIRTPDAAIAAGFPPAMPPAIAERMTDTQINDVIAFIRSLIE